MENFLLYVKEWWILTGVTIIYIDIAIRVTKGVEKMSIEKICKKIISDFNDIYDKPKPILRSELRPILIKKYKIKNGKAIRCIKYLKENEFIFADPINMLVLYWRKQ